MAKCELCGTHYTVVQKYLSEHLCDNHREMTEKAVVQLVPYGFHPMQVIVMVVREYMQQEKASREQIESFLKRLK